MSCKEETKGATGTGALLTETHRTAKEGLKMTLLADTQDLAEPLRPEGTARSTVPGAPLSVDELNKLDAFWRVCKYLALGMIYLQANPCYANP